MRRVVRVFDVLTWIMMVVTFVVSILTTTVAYAIALNKWLVPFINFRILEICLAITLSLWGITSIINFHDKTSKIHGLCFILLGAILMVFLYFGVY